MPPSSGTREGSPSSISSGLTAQHSFRTGWTWPWVVLLKVVYVAGRRRDLRTVWWLVNLEASSLRLLPRCGQVSLPTPRGWYFNVAYFITIYCILTGVFGDCEIPIGQHRIWSRRLHRAQFHGTLQAVQVFTCNIIVLWALRFSHACMHAIESDIHSQGRLLSGLWPCFESAVDRIQGPPAGE